MDELLLIGRFIFIFIIDVKCQKLLFFLKTYFYNNKYMFILSDFAEIFL